MIYLKEKHKDGKPTIWARFSNEELAQATKALIQLRRTYKHNFLYLSKERAGKLSLIHI